MRSKAIPLLIGASLILFLILLGEIYFLFFVKKNTTPNQDAVSSLQEKNLKNLYQKREIESVNLILQEAMGNVQYLKPGIRSGVVKEMQMTTIFKSVITEIGVLPPDPNAAKKGQTLEQYVVKFATMGEGNDPKEFRYILSKNEWEKIKVYKAEAAQEIPAKIESIQKGDYVSITVVLDMLAGPEYNLAEMKILKLL